MTTVLRLVQLLRSDPRHYQIAVLALLNLYGALALDFAADPVIACTLIATALLSQTLWTRVRGLPRLDLRSPLISSLSLCLLLRTTSPWLAVLAAFLTISSKFWIRRQGKHVFNPTNFGLAAMLLLSDSVWVSPGQWGSIALFAFLLSGLGGLVVHRAERSDVTYAFLLAYAAVLFGRAAWLGDPLAIPLHQMQNGAFLLFAFYMISDPRTTPDSRIGRILFAVLVALGAGAVHFVAFRTNGLIWSLVVASMTVPLIDRLFPGKQYQWPSRLQGRQPTKGDTHESDSSIPWPAPAHFEPLPATLDTPWIGRPRSSRLL